MCVEPPIIGHEFDGGRAILDPEAELFGQMIDKEANNTCMTSEILCIPLEDPRYLKSVP
tara:strand:- start:227 stop:403 length:177 start_codon:yes stop_codon:yes gene_type:complete